MEEDRAKLNVKGVWMGCGWVCEWKRSAQLSVKVLCMGV